AGAAPLRRVGARRAPARAAVACLRRAVAHPPAAEPPRETAVALRAAEHRRRAARPGPPLVAAVPAAALRAAEPRRRAARPARPERSRVVLGVSTVLAALAAPMEGAAAAARWHRSAHRDIPF